MKYIQPSVKEAIYRRDNPDPKVAHLIKNRKEARHRKPLVLTGVMGAEYATIPANDLPHIRIDETYQRMAVKSIVGDLTYVLKNGGVIPHPVTLVRRKDGSLWVADGQQRFWAHLDAEKPMKAMIFDISTHEEEKAMFIALNTTSRVGPGLITKSWPGPCVGPLLDANQDENHELYDRVNFGVGGFGRVNKATGATIGAVALMHGVAAVVQGAPGRGHISNLLQMLDARMSNGAAHERAATFLRLAPMVFASGGGTSFRLCSLGIVANRRWGRAPKIPSQKTINSIAAIDWKKMVETEVGRYLPVLIEEISRRWPERGPNS